MTETTEDPKAPGQRREMPPAAFIILAICAVAASLSALAFIVCAALDEIGLIDAPLALLLTFGVVFGASILVIPLLVALTWSTVLLRARAERPVRTAFKGVFGFLNRMMEAFSPPVVP